MRHPCWADHALRSKYLVPSLVSSSPSLKTGYFKIWKFPFPQQWKKRRGRFTVPGQPPARENSAQASLPCCSSVWTLAAKADCRCVCAQGNPQRPWFGLGSRPGQRPADVWGVVRVSPHRLSLLPVGPAARGETFQSPGWQLSQTTLLQN